MRIVLDANIVIAALLGSRGRLVLITAEQHELFAPSGIVPEIRKHKDAICSKTHSSTADFELDFAALLVFLRLIDQAEYAAELPRARAVMQRDRSDAHYLACALAVKADFIWTEDADFSTQHLVPVKTTAQFIEQRK